MQAEVKHTITMILNGDRSAEKALYERYEQFWSRICLRYGRNRHEAEDIMQEGLIDIFRNLKSFDPHRGQFSTWSGRVIVHAALRYLKKHHWQQVFDDIELAGKHDYIPETAIAQLSAKELTALIQQLPSGYRIVFNMYAIEGYTHKEIGMALGITESASRSQLTKARKLLRSQINALFDVH